MKRALPIAVALFLIVAGAVLHFAYGVNSPKDLVSLIDGKGVTAGDSDQPEPADATSTAESGATDGASGDTSETGEVAASDKNLQNSDPQDELAADQSGSASTSDTAGDGADSGAKVSDEAAADAAQGETSGDLDQSAEQLAALPTTDDLASQLAPESESSLSSGESEGTVVPSFDLVRVESSGESVIAGRAAPLSTVQVYDGDVLIGETTADSSGSWVLLPDDLLAPGSHSLTVVTLAEDGSQIRSEQVAVVVVPEFQLASDALGDKSLTPEDPVVPAAIETEEELAELPEAGEKVVEEALESGDKLESETPLVVLLSEEEGQASKVLQGTQRSDDSGIRQDGLVLESIDYNAEGGSIIAGQAPSGTQVILYMDNQVVGHATADENGRWLIELTEGVAPGLHVLRVDQVDENGAVISRVETPYSQPESVPQGSLEVAQVVVQPGNSLWRISRRSYGQGVLYSVIFEANRDQIRDPDLIYPGQIFAIPRVE